MSYQIVGFDGLALSPYLQSGDVQDMGTGTAVTNFLSLPGGGFLDGFGKKRSPSSIYPITKSCVLWGDDDEDLREQFDALRAKKGKLGKLNVLFDDGSARWQWARLQGLVAPREARQKGGWLPVELTWITASQNWYGITHGAGWTWGDLTWTWGDGTAEFGEVDYFYEDVTGTTVTLANDGNAICRNLRVEAEVKSGTADDFVLTNLHNGAYVASGLGLDIGDIFILDVGARAFYFYGVSVQVNITSIVPRGDVLLVTTNANPFAEVGSLVRVAGTDNYDGEYLVRQVDSTTVLRLALEEEDGLAPTVETTGTLRRGSSLYPTAEIWDKRQWFPLAPGNNYVQIEIDGTIDIEFKFSDTFA